METPKEKLTNFIVYIAENLGFDPLLFIAIVSTPFVFLALKKLLKGEELSLTQKIYKVTLVITALIVYLYLIFKYFF